MHSVMASQRAEFSSNDQEIVSVSDGGSVSSLDLPGEGSVMARYLGNVAAQHSGPAVGLSLLLASIVCLLAGLCYSELAAMIPVAGSAYSYTYATLGEGIAWTVGWCLMLEYLFSASLVAISWAGYMQSTLHQIGA